MTLQVSNWNIEGKSHEKNFKSIMFLGLLWLSLFIAFLFLVVLLVTTAMNGAGRYDMRLFTEYNNTTPEDAGARAAILGSLFVVSVTALMAIPVGIAAAVYLEEFADRTKRLNRIIELNIQNLAAVPAIIYGMLALGVLNLIGLKNKNVVIGGSLALALLILPVVILTTREAMRAVPQEIRDGSLALGATEVQTVVKQTLPAAIPGIATGTILAVSRAIGEAAPLLLLGALVFITYDPNTLLSGFTTMPIQVFGWTSAPQEEFKALAAATSMLLLVILLSMNALAIYIRNKFAKRW
jgi:phosphate ABC transporter permease subunit PstA